MTADDELELSYRTWLILGHDSYVLRDKTLQVCTRGLCEDIRFSVELSLLDPEYVRNSHRPGAVLVAAVGFAVATAVILAIAVFGEAGIGTAGIAGLPFGGFVLCFGGFLASSHDSASFCSVFDGMPRIHLQWGRPDADSFQAFVQELQARIRAARRAMRLERLAVEEKALRGLVTEDLLDEDELEQALALAWRVYGEDSAPGALHACTGGTDRSAAEGEQVPAEPDATLSYRVGLRGSEQYTLRGPRLGVRVQQLVGRWQSEVDVRLLSPDFSVHRQTNLRALLVGLVFGCVAVLCLRGAFAAQNKVELAWDLVVMLMPGGLAGMAALAFVRSLQRVLCFRANEAGVPPLVLGYEKPNAESFWTFVHAVQEQCWQAGPGTRHQGMVETLRGLEAERQQGRIDESEYLQRKADLLDVEPWQLGD